MDEIRDMLRVVDRVPAPDLSDDIWRRVAEPADRSVGVRMRRFPRAFALAAGILLLIGVATGALLLAGDQGPADTGSVAADAGWLTDPAGTMTSCVEQFSVDALVSRSWAFSGMITAVEPPRDPESGAPEDLVTSVTFRVEHWYKGGPAETVTFLTYSTPASPSSDGQPDASIGARLLVSGDDRYIWGCGFTRPYTDENAALFEDAFPR
jgi:hypothetical protein